jgi:hypothetical protein
MHNARVIVGASLVGASVVSWAASASAQEREKGVSYLNESLPAPSRAFELKLGTGYTQGIGNVAPGQSILSVGGAGLALSFDTDYRMNPRSSVGLEAQYQEFTTQNNGGTRGVAFNVGGTYHLSPEKRGDLWGRLGVGYRMLWDVHPEFDIKTTNMYHGFDVATLKIGYDIRTSSDIALAPVIGANLQTFIWKDATQLSTVQLGTFIYAGLQARFDTGQPASGGPVISARR